MKKSTSRFGLKYTRMSGYNDGEATVAFVPSINKWVAREKFRSGSSRRAMTSLGAFDTKEQAEEFLSKRH